jgi:hypothetical protein
VFEQETESIITAVRHRTIAASQTIAIKDILAADIPYPIKAFFRADVESLLLEELRTYRKKSRFAYDHPEVQALQQQINSVLVLQFSFPRLEYLQRLNDAVHMIINYLVRPQWTLASALFDKQPSITAASIVQLLRYFGPYEYLKDIVVRYVHEKNIALFTDAEFATFLWRVDGEYIKRKTGDELARIMTPLFEFFDFPRRTGALALPIKALQKHFEDKGLITAAARLEGELEQGRTELTRQQLGEILEDVRRSVGAFVVGQKEESAVPDRTSFVNAAATVPGRTVETAATVQRPVIDLDKSFSDYDRRRFIRKVFRQNEEAYHSALHGISMLNSWKEVSRHIDEVFIANDVDPYSSDAKRFVELLFQKYHPTQ